MLERSGARLTPQRLSQVAAQARARLEATWRLIASLSHTNILARGFALVRRAGGEPVTRVGALSPGERFRLQMQDGEIAATAEGSAGGAPHPAGKRKPAAGGQGDLY
jgi:exodeoxyribonuclease VII large subunit